MVEPLSIFHNFGFSALSFLLILAIVLSLSCYIKIVTVLSILRAGLGMGSLPSVFVTGSLALALSFFVMYPTLSASARAADARLGGRAAVNDQARTEALTSAFEVWKTFVRKHATPADVDRFAQIALKMDAGSVADVSSGALDRDSWRVLAPAFVISELKSAFATGLSLFLPFFVLDLLAASILAALSLEKLSPALVSFPFKLLLFVVLDGWSLITANLVATYI